MTSRREASTAAAQRQALVAALRSVDPGAPTLCEGWTARDLALHIVVRDGRPDLLLGEHLPVMGPRARRGLELLAQDYEALIERIAAGPPRYSPQRLRAVDEAVNTAEFYIHTQDVLRAQPEHSAQTTDPVDRQLRHRLWRQAGVSFFLVAARKSGHRLVFLSPGYGALTRGSRSAPLRTVAGLPEELILWASGRRERARVELSTPGEGDSP